MTLLGWHEERAEPRGCRALKGKILWPVGLRRQTGAPCQYEGEHAYDEMPALAGQTREALLDQRERLSPFLDNQFERFRAKYPLHEFEHSAKRSQIARHASSVLRMS
jgi:hypothetical protein